MVQTLTRQETMFSRNNGRHSAASKQIKISTNQQHKTRAPHI
jgi:hypothetical protein